MRSLRILLENELVVTDLLAAVSPDELQLGTPGLICPFCFIASMIELSGNFYSLTILSTSSTD